MSIIKYIFTPNYVRYEGVRPINVYLLRVLYFLMFVGVGLQTWSTIINHQGPWDHTKAVAFCVWAAYPTLSIFGLIRPLRWLPIVIFMIFYKTLWVIVVAYPLWRAGALAGSPAEEMAQVFFWAPFVGIIVPWIYVFKNYVFVVEACGKSIGGWMLSPAAVLIFLHAFKASPNILASGFPASGKTCKHNAIRRSEQEWQRPSPSTRFEVIEQIAVGIQQTR